MGAWSADPFGNDEASDFADAFLKRPSAEFLSANLRAVSKAPTDADLEAPDCERALAAAEIVAALAGKPAPKLPEDIAAWLAGTPGVKASARLLKESVAAVRRVAEKSELQELWAEGEGDQEWTAAVEDLKTRLDSVAPVTVYQRFFGRT